MTTTLAARYFQLQQAKKTTEIDCDDFEKVRKKWAFRKGQDVFLSRPWGNIFPLGLTYLEILDELSIIQSVQHHGELRAEIIMCVFVIKKSVLNWLIGLFWWNYKYWEDQDNANVW